MSNQSDIHINEIIVSGNKRTKADFFSIEMQNIKSAMKYHDLRNEIDHIKSRLLGMNMFDKVDIDIQETSNVNATHGSNKVDLKVNVEEKGIPFLKMSSYIKSGTGSEQIGFELQGALRNPFGYGETYRLSSITSAIGTKEFLSTLSIPNIFKNQSNVNISLKSVDDSHQYYQSYKQHVDSLVVDISSKDNRQQLIAEYAIRDEIPLLNFVPLNNTSATGLQKDITSNNPTTSNISSNNNVNHSIFATPPTSSSYSTDKDISGTSRSEEIVLYPSVVTTNSLRASLKTSLKYIHTITDTRDSACNPSKGTFLQGNIEVALPPGTAQFCKAEVNVQQHYRLGPSYMGQPGLVASFCGSLGILHPLFTSSSEQSDKSSSISMKHGNTFLSDRYHLGGPNSLRGFSINGTGPRAQRMISIKSPIDPATSTTLKATTTTAATIMNQKINNTTTAFMKSDSLGGDLKSTILATLSTPIPLQLLANNHGRAFIFLNGGSIANYFSSHSSNNNMPSSSNTSSNPTTTNLNGILNDLPLLGSIRASIGVGVSISVAETMRLELSYAIPIIKSSQDQTKAFQLGVGITMN